MNLNFGSMIITTVALLVMTTSNSLAEFVLEIQVFSITTSNTTNCGADESTPDCETYLSIFCLREGRSTTSSDTTDCPLGFANRTYYYYYEPLPTRYIISDQPWTEAFQLYINARDQDDSGEEDDNIDDIYINMEFTADSRFPFREVYIGERGNVAVDLSVRVQCLEDYYGADCFTFCLSQDNNEIGHFVCNAEDGTITCLAGFQNPENYCMDTVTSAFRTPSVDTLTLVGYITLASLLAVSLVLNISLIFIVLVLWRKMCQKSRELTGVLQHRDEGIELKTNAIYGLTTPSEHVHVYGQNSGSETLRSEYDYITTNAYL